jgi:hypothetical protein
MFSYVTYIFSFNTDYGFNKKWRHLRPKKFFFFFSSGRGYTIVRRGGRGGGGGWEGKIFSQGDKQPDKGTRARDVSEQERRKIFVVQYRYPGSRKKHKIPQDVGINVRNTSN